MPSAGAARDRNAGSQGGGAAQWGKGAENNTSSSALEECAFCAVAANVLCGRRLHVI